MGTKEAIIDAVHEWYEEEGIRASTVVLHPKDYHVLINEIGVPPLRMMGDTTLRMATACSTLRVMVAAQEVEGEFVLADERHAHRRIVPMEGDGVKSLIVIPKVLVVKRSSLFLKRTPKGKFLSEIDTAWSEKLLQLVSEQFDIVIVFNDTSRQLSGPPYYPYQSLEEKVKELIFHNIGVANYNVHDRLGAIQIWKTRILEVGGKIKKVQNINDINCFNIPSLTVARHITWIDGEGDAKLGILPEKAISFADLAKERESRSNW